MRYTILKTHVYLFLAVDSTADPLGLYVASLATFQQCHRANLARQGPQGGGERKHMEVLHRKKQRREFLYQNKFLELSLKMIRGY